MTRIGSMLVQPIEDTGVVVMDEANGEEVFIPARWLRAVSTTIRDLADAIGAEDA